MSTHPVTESQTSSTSLTTVYSSIFSSLSSVYSTQPLVLSDILSSITVDGKQISDVLSNINTKGVIQSLIFDGPSLGGDNNKDDSKKSVSKKEIKRDTSLTELINILRNMPSGSKKEKEQKESRIKKNQKRI